MKRLLVPFMVCLSLVGIIGCKKLFRRGLPDAAVTVAEPEAVETPESTADAVDTTRPIGTQKPVTAKPLVKPAVQDAAVAAAVVVDAGAPKTATADAGSADVSNAFAVGQKWSGSYLCPQGKTDVTLFISHVTGNNVEAVFDFKVPNAPNGSFKTSGAYSPATRHLRLNPGAWIIQPAGYGSVPVDATVSADGHAYTGKIVSPGCSDFSVLR